MPNPNRHRPTLEDLEQMNARLIALVRDAHRAHLDIAEWIAQGLSRVAEELPEQAESLLAQRPGSWEAGLVRQLIYGSIGWPDVDY